MYNVWTFFHRQSFFSKIFNVFNIFSNIENKMHIFGLAFILFFLNISNSDKLMGIMDFPITFRRNGYGCEETLNKCIHRTII